MLKFTFNTFDKLRLHQKNHILNKEIQSYFCNKKKFKGPKFIIHKNQNIDLHANS